MFRRLFAPDSDLMVVMTWITDCIFLSVFWLLGCAPVVTIGASCAAVYDATYRTFRRKHKHSWQRFWRVWLDNWKCGILPGMFVVAAMAAADSIGVCVYSSGKTVYELCRDIAAIVS